MSEIVRPRLPSAARRRFAALALLVMVLAAGLGCKLWLRPATVEPPALDPAGMDPKVWQAVEAAREAVGREPNSDRAWGRLGMVLLAHQFRAEAGIGLARAEQLNGKDVRWPYYQALAIRRTDPETAIVHLRHALATDGVEMEAPRLLLAELLAQCEQRDEAETLFQEVLTHDPASSRAHLGLARLAFEREDWPGCLTHLPPAQESPCTRKAATTLLAEVRQRQGDRAGAEEALAQAGLLSDDPPCPDPLTDSVRGLVGGI